LLQRLGNCQLLPLDCNNAGRGRPFEPLVLRTAAAPSLYGLYEGAVGSVVKLDPNTEAGLVLLKEADRNIAAGLASLMSGRIGTNCADFKVWTGAWIYGPARDTGLLEKENRPERPVFASVLAEAVSVKGRMDPGDSAAGSPFRQLVRPMALRGILHAIAALLRADDSSIR
jgi:hypothetical protein